MKQGSVRVGPFRSPLARGVTPALLLVACAGGQSGNEGERPTPPCAGPGGLLEGSILDVGDGCVTVQIDRMVSAGDGIVDGEGNVLFSGQAQVGDVVVGKLGTVYAYTHGFEVGEPVVILPGPFGDALELQLMPGGSGNVEVHWGRRFGELPVEGLLGAECVERLEKLPESGGTRSSSTLPTQAQPATPTCEQSEAE